MIALAKAEEASDGSPTTPNAQLQDELGKLEATRARIASDVTTAEKNPQSLYDHARTWPTCVSLQLFGGCGDRELMCRLTADPA